MKTDIQIAQEAVMSPITEIAAETGIPEKALDSYGKYKAKVDHRLVKELSDRENGKLILVTAITPTPAGEGKTTISVGLADALHQKGKRTMLTLREPSLGPVFGIKGGAAGGGYAQVVPMEDINLHFTGDLHAIGAANNLLAAMLDNHIHQGNSLHIDPRRIVWRRCVDMNDRQLRSVIDGLGGKASGIPRQDGFDITVASEVMAVFCLAETLSDLKKRLSSIVVGYTYSGDPVTVHDLGAEGAMTALLKDAFNPNLVQTLEHTPALIHGGPFANIAHGCNSVIATKLAMKLADYTVTEAGFGADLGAEKFLDIKCRKAKIAPSAIVLVATIRALKHHGGCAKEDFGKPNVGYLKIGSANLRRHIENLRDVYGIPVVVTINSFPTDSKEEIDYIFSLCKEMDVPCTLSDVFSKGGAGALALADEVIHLAESEEKHKLFFAYDPKCPSIKEKIEAVCRKIYHAAGVTYSDEALRDIKDIEAQNLPDLAVCIAKTQYSFSDNASRLAAPEGFTMAVRNVRLSAGAGFAVPVMGPIMTMPGLPKKPAALNIDVDDNGMITGLF